MVEPIKSRAVPCDCPVYMVNDHRLVALHNNFVGDLCKIIGFALNCSPMSLSYITVFVLEHTKWTVVRQAADWAD